jgi:hypothetical protein
MHVAAATVREGGRRCVTRGLYSLPGGAWGDRRNPHPLPPQKWTRIHLRPPPPAPPPQPCAARGESAPRYCLRVSALRVTIACATASGPNRRGGPVIPPSHVVLRGSAPPAPAAALRSPGCRTRPCQAVTEPQYCRESSAVWVTRACRAARWIGRSLEAEGRARAPRGRVRGGAGGAPHRVPGPQGAPHGVLRRLGEMPPEARPAVGAEANRVKAALAERRRGAEAALAPTADEGARAT